MGKKINRSTPVVYDPPAYSAEENETRYKKDYEFDKPTSARSPVNGWEDKYIRQGAMGTPPKEARLVKGAPATFKGRRIGSVYGSRPTTRKIGKK